MVYRVVIAGSQYETVQIKKCQCRARRGVIELPERALAGELW